MNDTGVMHEAVELECTHAGISDWGIWKTFGDSLVSRQSTCRPRNSNGKQYSGILERDIACEEISKGVHYRGVFEMVPCERNGKGKHFSWVLEKVPCEGNSNGKQFSTVLEWNSKGKHFSRVLERVPCEGNSNGKHFSRMLEKVPC